MRRRHRLRPRNLPHGHIFGATFWGIPAKNIRARVVRVRVGDTTDEKYWARDLVGTERYAIEMRIDLPGQYEIFYLDNNDWKTINYLTSGKGDPTLEFKQLMVTEIIPDPEIKVSYGFTQSGDA